MTTIYNDDVKVTLIESIDETTTTLSVSNPAGIYLDPPSPTGGQIATLKIVDRINNPTRREIITYTGRSAIAGGFSLTGVTRGAVPMLWEAGCFLVGVITDVLTEGSNITIVDGVISSSYKRTFIVQNPGFNEDVTYIAGVNQVPNFVLGANGSLIYTELE